MYKFVGCSGFFYWGWKGKFYPEDLKPSEWFSYYSSIFNTVEINSTFYNFPKKNNLKRWYKTSPENFVFSVKVNKVITHIKRFKNAAEEIEKFYSVVSQSLQEKLGAILFQLPPGFKYSKENLERIINSVDKSFTNVIEFRHKSWWNKDVYEIFKKNNLIFCSISAPEFPEDLIKTGDTIYIRFHGKENWYKYDYSDEELKSWAKKIKNSGAKTVFAYFNNDFYGYAPKNALRLIEFLNNEKK